MKDETKDETRFVSLPWEAGATSTPADARGGTGDQSFDDAQKTGEVARLREAITAKDQQRAMLTADLQALQAKQAIESDSHLQHQHQLDKMKLEAQLRERASEREALRDELRRAEDRRYEEQRKERERERLEAQAKEERDALIAQREQVATIEQERIRLRNRQLADAAPVALVAFIGSILLGRWIGGDK